MAPPEGEDAWKQRQKRREERTRYEVLFMLYGACAAEAGCVLRVSDFAQGLGAWREELFRAVEFLDRAGYIVYHGAGPAVSITPKGIQYIEGAAGRRRSIRD